MKRTITVSLILLILVSTIGCSQLIEEEREREIKAPSSVLVAYFSVTGNTEEIANYIANQVQADIFRIEPEVPYDQDDLTYESTSRVMIEYNDRYENRVSLKETKVPNWSSYDVVFLGYPIWFEDAAWPTFSFVEENDFIAKTVIPFCTSNQTGIEKSQITLEKFAGTGVWETGRRFSADSTEEEVTEWLRDLGY